MKPEGAVTLVLQDHFHPPLEARRHWRAFHSAWALAIVSNLNGRLAEGYFAEPNLQNGIKIDVATFESRDSGRQQFSPGLAGPRQAAGVRRRRRRRSRWRSASRCRAGPCGYRAPSASRSTSARATPAPAARRASRPGPEIPGATRLAVARPSRGADAGLTRRDAASHGPALQPTGRERGRSVHPLARRVTPTRYARPWRPRISIFTRRLSSSTTGPLKNRALYSVMN